jgi:YebC/PmpR family DNA-binding regulatory protein
MYEAYGPGGVALLVECLTDNRNRAAAEVRTAITRNGGNPADPGSVSYLFGRKGVVLVTKTDGLTEDDVLLAVLEAGAEDVNDLEETFEVVCSATDTHAVRLACTDAGFDVQSADISWMPTLSIPLEDEAAIKVLKLVDALEDLDDVQNVWANFDISDEVFERVG